MDPILYIPVELSTSALTISQTFWELSRPSSQRESEEVTFGYCGSLIDTSGNEWLSFPTNHLAYIHPLADDSLLDPVFDAVIAVVSSQAEIDAIEAQRTKYKTDLGASRGTQTNTWELLPDFWKSKAQTYQQLVDAGLLS